MGKSGPNKRRTRSKSRGVEIATPRTTYPGGKGYESLGHLGNLSGEFRKAGLYQEDEKPADNLEERRLFEVKQEMKKLITELDNSKFFISCLTSNNLLSSKLSAGFSSS